MATALNCFIATITANVGIRILLRHRTSRSYIRLMALPFAFEASATPLKQQKSTSIQPIRTLVSLIYQASVEPTALYVRWSYSCRHIEPMSEQSIIHTIVEPGYPLSRRTAGHFQILTCTNIHSDKKMENIL